MRASALSHLLVAAATRFDVGAVLDRGPMEYRELCKELGLAERAATVLFTGLRSLGLITVVDRGLVALASLGREKLAPSSPFALRGYLALGAHSADARAMIACLENDAPAGDVSYVYREGMGPSALDDPEKSDTLTRAMAARARNVAPFVAEALDLRDSHHLVDVGGGHGIYTLELLARHPHLNATIIDRAPPLRVAREYAEAAGLLDRVELVFGDIHSDPVPDGADVILLANILHDYGAADAERLLARYARALRPGGRVIILDALLESVPPGSPPISTGPREVAAYSAMLFSISEGRCYRRDEYEHMLRGAALEVDGTVSPVPAHGSLLTGRR